MPSPITIYSIARSVADGDGGQILDVLADFANEFGKAYRIHIGPNGDATDPACYSGHPGYPQTLFVLNTSKLRGYLPPMPAGGPYHIFVRRLDMSRTALITSAIQVMPKMYYSGVFGLRGILPTQYRTGPRNLELLEPTA